MMDIKLLFVISLIAKLNNGRQTYDVCIPKNIIPEDYNIKITTHLDEGGPDDFTFSGEVEITVKSVEETNRIIIHSVDLQFGQKDIKVEDINGGLINVIRKSDDNFYEIVYIDLENNLKANKYYKIHIKYEGELFNRLAGLYRSYYLETGTKKKRWIASTQFEPIYARRAFPCFDEPSLKATFKISLGHRNYYSSISNMPLEKTEKISGKNWEDWKMNVFKRTPRMSTYLIAFVISDFNYTQSASSLSDTPHRVWSRYNTKTQRDFGAEIGAKATTYLEKTLDVKFVLPKQDIVAIPEFAAGAMENWGLIIHKESSLLVHPQLTLETTREQIALMLCHEISHQWFGNLVTLHWWSDTWLNEGFPSYYQEECLGAIFPNSPGYITNYLNYMLVIYNLDSLVASRPISDDIKDIYKFRQMFDGISYQKGGILIRMIKFFMGTEHFQRGISNYIKKNKYENVHPDDLWTSLENQFDGANLQNNASFKTIMDTWIKQSGFPLVIIIRDYEKGTVTITQKRFLQSGTENDANSCWWIPLTYTTENEKNFQNTKPKLWLTCPRQPIIIKFNHPDKWILFNIQLSAKSGQVHYSLCFELGYELRDYQHPLVVLAYTRFSSSLIAIITMKKNQVTNIESKTGCISADGQSYQSKKKYIFVDFDCKYNLDNCKLVLLESSRTSLNLQGKDPIDYCTLLRNGTSKQWYTVYKMYLNSTVPTEQTHMLDGMACTYNKKLLKRFLSMLLHVDKYFLKKQDIPTIFAAISRNKNGVEITRTMLYENMKEFFNLLLPTVQQIGVFVNNVAANIITSKEYQKFMEFLKANEKYLLYASHDVNLSKETIENNIQWIEKYSAIVENLLVQYGAHK